MNWEAIGAIGNVVGAVAVTITLIYLIVQIKQNNKLLRLNTANVVTEELQAMFSLLAADKDLSEIFIEAGKCEVLEGVNRVRYYTFTNNLMRIYENAFLQKKERSIPEAHWVGLTRLMIDYTDMPAFASYWRDRKHWGSDEFIDYLESEIISSPAKRDIRQPGAM
ncbi:MAG: hypothetical protein KTR33_00255 [Gammaproteobacteria bacterium]|nr:hypothetical protein [Gammaproteobacteria bacterium]